MPKDQDHIPSLHETSATIISLNINDSEDINVMSNEEDYVPSNKNNSHPEQIVLPTNNIPPLYRDLFAAMLHEDDTIANAAFDKVMFQRGLAVPHLCDQYALAFQKTAEDRKLRYYCIQLISFSGVKTGKETVLAALSDEAPQVRKEALYAVEDLNIKKALPLVRERLQDLDEDVRRVAQEVYDYLLSI